jgi:hypothetical protein
VKIDKKILALLKQIVNIPKEDMEDCNWAMFTHAMDFFKEHTNLKKPISKYFFTNLFNDLLIEELTTNYQ